MTKRFRLVNWLLRRVFQAVCRIDLDEIEKISSTGPLIIVGNHVNFLEAPVLLAHLDNPIFVGVAKRESWNNPLFNFLFNYWGVIPIDRGTVDREAFRLSTESLKQGKILVISPEGTRSKDGRLLPGKAGVLALAARSDAPFLPIGLYGYEKFWENLKHFRRTNFHLKVGKPFRLKMNSDLLSRDSRQAVVDEVMYKIAELLPEEYRGHYQYKEAIEYQFVKADE